MNEIINLTLPEPGGSIIEQGNWQDIDQDELREIAEKSIVRDAVFDAYRDAFETLDKLQLAAATL